MIDSVCSGIEAATESSATVGNIHLYHADCREGLETLAGSSVNLVLTNPPYFIDGMDDGWSPERLKEKVGKAGAIRGLPVGMKFDSQQGVRLEKFFYEVATEVKRVLVPGGYFLSFAQPRLYHRMATAIENAGFEVRDLLTWEHGGGQGKAFTMNHFVERMDLTREGKDALIASMVGGKTPQLRPMFEAILLAQKPKEGTFVENWKRWGTGLIWPDFEEGQQTTIFKYAKPNSRSTVDHLTIKPVDLMERLLRVFSIEGHTVLDLFSGSAPTGIACLNTHRNFIGFEINEKYFELGKKRITEAEAQQELRRGCSGWSMHDLGTRPAGQVPGPQGPPGYTGPRNFTGYMGPQGPTGYRRCTGPGNFTGYTGPQSGGSLSNAESRWIARN